MTASAKNESQKYHAKKIGRQAKPRTPTGVSGYEDYLNSQRMLSNARKFSVASISNVSEAELGSPLHSASTDP
jgi:hypothetical protein